MKDPRPFNERNVGNPNSAIKENIVRMVPTPKGSKSISIPKNIGAFNTPKRK